MGFRSAIMFSISFGLSVLLAGCSDYTTQSSDRFELASGSSASGLWAAVSQNARGIGAKFNQAGDAAIVTYRGGLRDFVVCSRNSSASNASGNERQIALDSRTKFVLNGTSISADTVYIATTQSMLPDGTSAPLSTTFGGSDVGNLLDGVSCRATGNLERRLLGQG